MSMLEDAFDTHWIRHAVGLTSPVREYRFAPPRRWRFDYAWPDQKIAVELEGGTWGKSRHTTGRGYEGDCYKYNAAAAEGWRVLRFTTTMLDQDPLGCIAQISELLEATQ